MFPENLAAVGEVFEVFVIYTGDGERHAGHPDGRHVYLDKQIATEKAKGMGWYGGNAHVGRHLAIKDKDGLYWLVSKQIDDINEIRFNYEADVKKKALKKLSDEECRVLGLK